MTGALVAGQLEGANWDGAILHGAQIAGELSDSDFRRASLHDVYFISFDASGSDFRGSDVSQARFSSGSLVGARFDGANLQNAWISSTEIENVSFRNADMRGASFNNISSFAGVDFSGADIRGAGFSALTYDGLTLQQIAVTRSYQEKDLSGVNFAHNEWPGSDWSDFRLVGADFNRGLWEGANFSRADLTGADFEFARITGANFTDAIVRQTSFRGTGQYGFTRQMLESTASYKNRDLFGINLEGITMDFWDFRAQDLRGADLRHSSMRGALMDLADLRSALMPPSYGPNDNPQPNDIPNADLSRTIRRTGRLDLLRVDPGEVLTIRNAVDMNGLPTPTNIQLGVAVFDGGGSLRFLLSEDPWKSTIVVPGNRPEYVFSDTLELGFDRDTDPYSLLNKPVQLFLWPRFSRTGEFHIVTDPKYTWDLSQLYSNGTVRLVGIVPEPGTVATALLMTAAGAGVFVRRRRRQ
jgi:uncharacterized protein YjbI with pentapeptide repeats